MRTFCTLRIFEKGLSNNRFHTQENECSSALRRILKIIRLILYRISCGKRRKLSSRKVLMAWFPLHQKILEGYEGEMIIVLDHTNHLNGHSFLSYMPFAFLLKELFSIPISILKRGLSYEWCFYRALCVFLDTKYIDSLIMAGHYDKYATWISYLAKEKGLYLTISQHGLTGNLHIPYKIPVNRIEAFSKAEGEMFRYVVLSPDKTEFYVKGFRSSLLLIEGGFRENTIAIASQPGYEDRVLKMVNVLHDINCKNKVVVYSHPSDDFRKEKQNLIINEYCQLEHFNRYWDVDYLLVFTSTLAYDYWACSKFKGKVLCCYEEGLDIALYNDERSIVLYPETYIAQLKTLLG